MYDPELLYSQIDDPRMLKHTSCHTNNRLSTEWGATFYPILMVIIVVTISLTGIGCILLACCKKFNIRGGGVDKWMSGSGYVTYGIILVILVIMWVKKYVSLKSAGLMTVFVLDSLFDQTTEGLLDGINPCKLITAGILQSVNAFICLVLSVAVVANEYKSS